MLYESDISQLLTRWEAGLEKQSSDYKIAVRDCIYDLKGLIDKQQELEAVAVERETANEAFEQQLEQDAQFWKDYYNAFLNNEGLM